MQYNRLIETQFLETMATGPLAFLLRDADWYSSDRFAFDVQLRENKFTVYHGTTKLLDIGYRKRRREEEIRLSANDRYRAVAGADKVMKTFSLSEFVSCGRLGDAVKKYLSAAVRDAAARYYRNQKEGFWQNRISIRSGLSWQPPDDWLVVDREAELSVSVGEQRKVQSPIQKKYEQLKIKVRRSIGSEWSKKGGDSLGNQCDFLAIGPKSQLMCVELKHGSDCDKITWGCLQVAVYRDLFEQALPEITQDIKDLVHQKIALGLLPKSAVKRIPSGVFKEAVAVLAVASPVDRSKCWQRLAAVMQDYPETRTQVVVFDDPGTVRASERVLF